MFFYQIIWFYIITCLYSAYNVVFDRSKSVNRLICVLLLICLALIAGFRESTIDSDFKNYVRIFTSIPSVSYLLNYDFAPSQSLETGYLLLNSLLKWVFDDYRSIFILMSFLHLFIYGYIFIKSTTFPIISLLVLLSTNYLFEMAQLRGGTVCALMLLAGYYISEKQVRNFLITILVGCIFHYTMLLALVLYPFSVINWTRKKIFIVLIICLVSLQMTWLNSFIEFLPDNYTLAIRLINYADDINAADEVGRIAGDVKVLLLLVLFSTLRPFVIKQERYYNTLLGMFVLAAVIRCGFHEYITFSTRLAEPVFSSQNILIPMLLYLPIHKYFVITLILIFCIFFFIRGLDAPFLYIMNNI